MSELNIYQRLAKITEELGVVAKGLTVGSGSYGYKAVGEVDVLNAVKPLESKYGVYSYPMNRKVVESQVLVDSKDKTKFFLRVETTYRFVNVDNPSEFVDQVSYGDGIDSLDKAPGKSMTYSDKYSLMKAYKMVTGDDPDRHHSNETKIIKKYKTKSYGDVTEDEATESARKKGLGDLLKSLEKPENVDYKVAVMQTICEELKVDKWYDIKFTKELSYKDLIFKVQEVLKKEKDLANAGI